MEENIMLKLGCHLTSSKGYEFMGRQALEINADTFQFFTRNPRGGKAKYIDPEDVKRFLEIADKLKLKVAVVTDNDGDVSALRNKYSSYSGNQNIKICYDSQEDDSPTVVHGKSYNCNTLEPKLLKVNNRELFSKIFDTSFVTDDDLLWHMKTHKTDCALAICRSIYTISYPQYILDSIE